MPSDADQLPATQAVESNGHDHPADSDYVIAHVLFLDIVGFTRLVSGKQKLVLQKLQEIVRETKEFCAARNKEQLIALATGDGMALVFLTTEGGSGPAKSCAERIAAAIKDYNQTAEDDSKIKVRMGINSGNVIRVCDINQQRNVAGVGINLAQRVMDCGDADHILLSQQAWDFLPDEQKVHCQPFENEVIVKHGHTVRLHNLLYNGIGNKEIPKKIRQQIKKKVKKIKAQAQAQARRENFVTGQAEARKAELRRRTARRAMVGLSLIALAVSVFIIVKLSAPPSPPSPPSLSLAVLPFRSESKKNSSKAISDGLTDQFVRSFKFLTTIKPMPLSTIKSTLNQQTFGQSSSPQPLPPLEAAKQLQVRYVLTGEAEAYNDDPNLESIPDDKPPDFKVDVHVVLYDTEKGSEPLWEKEYKPRPFDQLIELQKEIVKEVTAKMHGTMLKQENPDIDEDKLYTQKSGAYWNYLRGRFLFKDRATSKKGEEVTQKTISSYNKAIEIDQDYALAHAGLADVYNSISGSSRPPAQAKIEALKAVQKALSSGKRQPEIYAAIGTEKWWLERDYTTAKIAFLLAIEIQSDFTDSHKRYSSLLAALGEKDEAEKQILEALRLEPESSFFRFTSGQNYFFAHDYPKAINELEQVAKNSPTMFAAHRFLALAYEQTGKYDEALNHLAAAKDDSTDPDYSDNLGARAHILVRTNQVNDALGIAHNLEQLRGKKGIYISPYNIALIFAEIPDKEKDAFQWLDRAISEFDPRATWLKVDPRFNRLRQVNKQEFNKRLEAAGLPL